MARIGKEEGGLRIVEEVPELHVSHHPHHFRKRRPAVGSRDLHLPAQSVPLREQPQGRGAVQDHHGWRPGAVRGGERATLLERNAQLLEEPDVDPLLDRRYFLLLPQAPEADGGMP